MGIAKTLISRIKISTILKTFGAFLAGILAAILLADRAPRKGSGTAAPRRKPRPIPGPPPRYEPTADPEAVDKLLEKVRRRRGERILPLLIAGLLLFAAPGWAIGQDDFTDAELATIEQMAVDLGNCNQNLDQLYNDYIPDLTVRLDACENAPLEYDWKRKGGMIIVDVTRGPKDDPINQYRIEIPDRRWFGSTFYTILLILAFSGGVYVGGM